MKVWRHLQAGPRGVYLVVLLAGFLTYTGFGAIFAILPLFALDRGGSVQTVSLMAASYILAEVSLQYPFGALADRIGRRRVIAVALGVQGLLALAFFFAHGPVQLVALRLAQGAAAAAYVPAARGLLADLIPDQLRGEAFGQMAAADMAGLLLGPLLGGLIAAALPYQAVFVMQGGLVLVAALVFVLLAVGARGAGHHESMARTGGGLRLLLNLDMLGLSLLAMASIYLFGMYDTVWVLYMAHLHAGSLAIGLSISIFALPMLLFSGLAGRLGDRFGRRRPLLVSLVLTGLCAFAYPFLTSIPLILALGFLEGAFSALARPNEGALVASAAPRGMESRAQGLVNGFGTLSVLPAAVFSGFLFPIDYRLPFYLGAAFVLALTLSGGLLIYRRGSTLPDRAEAAGPAPFAEPIGEMPVPR